MKHKRCGFCGQPMRGYAYADMVPLCHPDYPTSIEDDCYRAVTVLGMPIQDGRKWFGSKWGFYLEEGMQSE